jgi:DmsE family decaheme c-type cytochrome
MAIAVNAQDGTPPPRRARRVSLPAVTGCALAALLLAGPPAVRAAEQDASPVAACAQCHDDVAKAFQANPHMAIATLKTGVNPCESCHGNGKAHIDSGDPAQIKIPKGEAAVAVCGSCHGDKAAGPAGHNVHIAAGIACVDCHAIHGADLHAVPLLRHPVGELCATCHAKEQADFREPYAHKLGRGDMSCVSCHDPHAGAGERSLKGADRAESPCVTCHTDKRGPFVFEHVTDMVGNCTTCHAPHGSSNPRRLARAEVAQLCLECHSPLSGATLGSQPPSFHDLTSPRYRECTTCHVAIHGSDTSPALLK